MNSKRQLRGIELRYVLTMQLLESGPSTVAELVDRLEWEGFECVGRASKSVSDALRWEIGRGRVSRLARGRYGPAGMPRSTEHRISCRVLALRAAARRSSLEGEHPHSA
jgi:hypothetical protein